MTTRSTSINHMRDSTPTRNTLHKAFMSYSQSVHYHIIIIAFNTDLLKRTGIRRMPPLLSIAACLKVAVTALFSRHPCSQETSVTTQSSGLSLGKSMFLTSKNFIKRMSFLPHGSRIHHFLHRRHDELEALDKNPVCLLNSSQISLVNIHKRTPSRVFVVSCLHRLDQSLWY